MAGMYESHARDLACGYFKRFHGYRSTHKSAKKARKRFLTVPVNPALGKREILCRSYARTQIGKPGRRKGI